MLPLLQNRSRGVQEGESAGIHLEGLDVGAGLIDVDLYLFGEGGRLFVGVDDPEDL